MDFDTLVPWKLPNGAFESALLKEDGSTNKGQFGRSVRMLPDNEFEAIVAAGFQKEPWELPQQQPTWGVAEPPDEFERPMFQQTLMRPFRDQAFRRSVRQAYQHKCAMTGIEIRNGLGRPEVEAAHIRPVEMAGPDSTRNGLALSGTVHWMFDRGLISVSDDLSILVASSGLPGKVQGLFNPGGKLRLPSDSAHSPHPKFLQFHRENIFKG